MECYIFSALAAHMLQFKAIVGRLGTIRSKLATARQSLSIHQLHNGMQIMKQISLQGVLGSSRVTPSLISENPAHAASPQVCRLSR